MILSNYQDLYKNAKIFSCGCREWTITDKDLKNEEPDQKDYLCHTCDKIKVYQKHGEVRRLFIRK